MPNVLVTNSSKLKANSVRELVEKGRSQPGAQARGAELYATRPSELRTFVASETERWQKTASNLGIKPDSAT